MKHRSLWLALTSVMLMVGCGRYYYRRGYYVAPSAVVVQPRPVVVAQPRPVVVAPQPTVYVQQPQQTVYVQQPQPTVVVQQPQPVVYQQPTVQVQGTLQVGP